MSQQLRILAAALALGDFTAAELAAHSGVPLSSVRSTIGRDKRKRQSRVFSETGEVRDCDGRGRPGEIYTLTNPAAVRQDLDDIGLQASLGGGEPRMDVTVGETQAALLDAADAAFEQALVTGGDDRRAALAAANDAIGSLLDATCGDAPPELRDRAVGRLAAIQTMQTTETLEEIQSWMAAIAAQLAQVSHGRQRIGMPLRLVIDELPEADVELRPLVRLNREGPS